VQTTFLIVGGGIAGLRAAVALAPAGRVTVLTKADPSESNTGYAQGGIAAAVGDDDSADLHAADTMRAVRMDILRHPFRRLGGTVLWGLESPADVERYAQGVRSLGVYDAAAEPYLAQLAGEEQKAVRRLYASESVKKLRHIYEFEIEKDKSGSGKDR
jgi:glycine/D-amino acid oxidase-like deaminating enzyme